MMERGCLMLVVSQFIGVRRRIIFAHFGRVVNELVDLKRVQGFAMVNATKGLFISCDIPMAQFIINYNNSLPASQKFIIHILDNTHLFVQPHASEMIRNAIQEFREQNSYEKPA